MQGKCSCVACEGPAAGCGTECGGDSFAGMRSHETQKTNDTPKDIPCGGNRNGPACGGGRPFHRRVVGGRIPAGERETTICCPEGEIVPLPDTLTILSWNIGYAGLGDNMDFFYDGGRRVRDTRARTAANLAQIVLTLQKIDADIMLLQEVDRSSHRTYRIDEAGLIGAAFPGYAAAFGFNYKAWFVPIPLRDPIGRVASGR